MSKITFKINTIKQEQETFDNLKKKVGFYKRYHIRFTWPKKSVKDEYNRSDYLVFKKWLQKEWQKRENNFLEKIEILFHFKIKKAFEVYISNYGSGGRYILPNLIIINKQLKYDYIKVIKHEIIHLLVEPFIQKYKIEHQHKEKIVNAILEILEPNISL